MPLSSIFPPNVLGHPKGESGTHEVPESKPPKFRPPRDYRDKVPFYGKLPYYSGPYGVGIIDIEIPAENPRTFSKFTRKNGVHSLELETVLISLYYPSAHGLGVELPKYTRPCWLPKPRSMMSRGYGKMARLPEWPTMAFFFASTWFTRLPAYRNARMANHWPPEVFRPREYLAKRKTGSAPEGESDKPVWPLLIFSHGLGGNRRAYSTICGEFASYGFLVCAVEHRDGSCARTLVAHHKQGFGSRAEREETGGIEHGSHAHFHRYDVKDFIFSELDKGDLFPSHHVDQELRAAQLDMRLAEIEEAYLILCRINAGGGDYLTKHNLQHPDSKGGPSMGLENVNWKEWEGRFHLDNVTMAGHSFGAATTVEVLRHEHRFIHVTQGIIYDIWGMAIEPPDDKPNHRIQAPLLAINSEAFMYWPDNFKVVKGLCDEVRNHGNPAWLMTVRGTVHISQSDFCVLYPHVANLLLKTMLNPIRAIDLNVDASLDFIDRVLPFKNKPFHRALGNKKLLDIRVIDEMPTEHVPKKKYTAIRLKVEHEASKRLTTLSPEHARQKYWKQILADGGEEAWLHASPDGLVDKGIDDPQKEAESDAKANAG